jgi:hypothetical protein
MIENAWIVMLGFLKIAAFVVPCIIGGYIIGSRIERAINDK